ncbi:MULTISPECIES: hypothetical protein [unclassified Mesorhizobium]|uniref:hypothetical protein n=1 Tax=unclassified Mesorhizobium TaxID=325217 RepID=UPI000FCCD4E5|nr:MULTISPECIES: hypothetical protein [unclassified Mesorhizobium]RUW22146.1 hypothetical protein EOA34_22270 [Mesorhizobium sp. M4B.F.Ca.ET.013.02.1.1]RVD21141.1 hypothetical protein EN738_19830 [Mesorhizobium sp. M4B.F.Ca.ET.017.02.2.1]
MQSAKPWWQSLAVWAGVFSLLNSAGLAGINIDFSTGDFNGNIHELGASLIGFVTSIGMIWGRIHAKTRIGK